MFCPKCGAQIDDEATHCPACGALVKDDQPSAIGEGASKVRDGVSHIVESIGGYAEDPLNAIEHFYSNAKSDATGWKWTLGEICRGKASLVLILTAVVMVFVLFVLPFGVTIRSVVNAVTVLSDSLGDLNVVQFALVLVDIYTFLIFFAPFVALLLKLYYNAIESKVAPTPQSKVVHDEQARFKWSILFSTTVSIFITAMLTFFFAVVMGGILYAMVPTANEEYLDSIFDSMMGVALLASALISEPVASWINYKLAQRFHCDYRLLGLLRAGKLDGRLPERMRNEKGRGRIANLLLLGAAGSINGSILICCVMEFLNKLHELSSPIESAAKTALTTCTIGAFGLVEDAYKDSEDFKAEVPPILSQLKKAVPLAMLIMAGYLVYTIFL